jgi:tRNA nucleotidyltransferase (CCA-adding enzyme)
MERLSDPELLAAVRRSPSAKPLLARLDDAATATVYLVGGAVRDLLLGDAPTELDLCVDGDPGVLADALGPRRRSHDRFGICTVELDGARFDIARTRREVYAYPGALPDVAPAPIEQDLGRRDFTINAIALALNGDDAGTRLAVDGAASDLRDGILRVLHPGSFRDDPTRLLRLARYAARLGFSPDQVTIGLVRDAASGHALETISGMRVGNELRLLAREADPVGAIAELDALGLGSQIAPGFGLVGPDPELARRALELLPDDGRRDLVVLAVAFRRSPDDVLDRRLTELGFTAGDHAVIAAAARRASELSARLERAQTPSEIARAAAGATPEEIAIAGAHGAARQARAWLGRLRQVALEIDGSDLRAAGVAEGPAIGAGLRAALNAKLDGRAAGRAEELAVAIAAAAGAEVA